MITPLAQRQLFQTANIEGVRAAHEVSEQLQREAMKKKAADDRLAEDQVQVNSVTGSDQIRTEERQGRRRENQASSEPEEEDGEAENSAAPAEPHLDLLA